MIIIPSANPSVSKDATGNDRNDNTHRHPLTRLARLSIKMNKAPGMGTLMRTIRTETNDIHWGRVSAEGGEVFNPRGSWYGWINRVAK